MRVLIEDGYARDVNPGVSTKVGLLPFRNPLKTFINFLVSIPTGIDDAIAEATGNPGLRPLGTKPVTSPFGVGGPELPAPPAEADANLMRSRTGDDPVTEGEGTQQDIATADIGGEPTEDQVVAGEESEETEETEKVTEKLELTVPGVIKHLQTRFGRGPVKSDADETETPSPAEPGNGDDDETNTSEPDSTPSEAGGAAAA